MIKKKLLPLLLCLCSTNSFAPVPDERTLSTQFNDWKSFSYILIERFGRLHGEIIVVASSGGRSFATTPLDTKKRNSLTRELLDNFGVNITDKGLDKVTFIPPYKMTFPSGSKRADFENKVGTKSLIGRAMSHLYEKGVLLNSDDLVNVFYGLRPWLTKDLKLTELVSGKIRVSRAGRLVDVPFYCPKDWEDDEF